MPFDKIQIISVVETNEETKSDDIYIIRFLNLYYGKFIQTNRVTIRSFVHAGSKTKLTSEKVLEEINGFTKCFDDKNSKSFPVFFVDTDRFGRKERTELEKILAYCDQKHFYAVLFSYEIEDVFNVQMINNSKKETSVRFASTNHNKDSFDIKTFSKSVQYVKTHRGFSNLKIVLDEIFFQLKML